MVPATFVTFVAGRPLRSGVGPTTLALTALVGGVLGVMAASLLEHDALRDLGVMPVLAAGLIEEAVKLVVPAALLVLLRPRHPADGLVLGSHRERGSRCWRRWVTRSSC